MDERSRVLVSTCVGAVAGGVWGWLYMTENGRRIRDQIEPKLDDLVNEIGRVRGDRLQALHAVARAVGLVPEVDELALNEPPHVFGIVDDEDPLQGLHDHPQRNGVPRRVRDRVRRKSGPVEVMDEGDERRGRSRPRGVSLR